MSVNVIPPRADPFYNREGPRSAMIAELLDSRKQGRQCRILLHGGQGIGTSSTASRFREEHADRFNTLIWLSGRHHDGTAVEPTDIISQLLSAFGVAEADQPASETERAGALLNKASGQRFMAVLDDLAQPRQLAALLNIPAPQAMIVATSPIPRAELGQEGFVPIAITELPQVEARKLFRQVLRDTARTIDEPTEHELVEHCSGIPLLIKGIAAQLAVKGHLARRILQRLRKSALEALSFDYEDKIINSLTARYQELDGASARALRLLALLPAADFTEETASAILVVEDSVDLLEDLVDCDLLTYSAETHRYRFPYPIYRDFALRCAEAEDEETVRAQVIESGLRRYIGGALRYGRAVSQRPWVPPVTALLHEWGLAAETSRPAALAWFDAECDGVVAAIALARRHGYHAWALAGGVGSWKYLQMHGKYSALTTSCRHALDSARDIGDKHGIMQLSSEMGSALLEIGEYQQARDRFSESLAAAREIGSALGEQSALEWLGKVAARELQLDIALDYFAQSLSIVEDSNNGISQEQRERARATVGLQRARVLVRKKEWEAARAAASAVRDYFDGQERETDNRAKSRVPLGEALAGAHDYTGAIEAFGTAVELFAEEGLDALRARTEVLLGKALGATGQSAQAVWESALAYFERVGSREADEVRRLLSGDGNA